ncbi:MAG: hypothetical protein K2L97_05775 [Muribaculaceae bacterium]|nr:hypothetical protein [Muribaculaceae bacterium]
MTHGELRGSLILIALMLTVILIVWLTKGSSSNVETPGTYDSRRIDSLKLEQSAAIFTPHLSTDSTVNPRAGTSEDADTSNPDKRQRRSHNNSSRTRKITRPAQPPTPSPLDRPAKSHR